MWATPAPSTGSPGPPPPPPPPPSPPLGGAVDFSWCALQLRQQTTSTRRLALPAPALTVLITIVQLRRTKDTPFCPCASIGRPVFHAPAIKPLPDRCRAGFSNSVMILPVATLYAVLVPHQSNRSSGVLSVLPPQDLPARRTPPVRTAAVGNRHPAPASTQ